MDDNHNDDKGATKLNIGCGINFSLNDLSLGSLYTIWSEGWRTLAKFKVIVSVQSPTIRLMPWCKNSFRDLIVPSYDIGDVGLKGSATKDSCSGSWKVLGSGTGLSSEKDEFQYTYFKESRDVDISVRLDSFNATKPSAKAGIMIRQSLEPGSKHYSILLNITSSETAELINQWRGSPDVDAASSKKPGHNMGTSAIVWLRITKKGNQFHGYFKEEETSNWISFGEVPMINFSTPSRFFVGLAVTSHDQTKLVALDASNLEIKELAPPPPTKSPTRHPTKSPSHKG